MKALLTNLIWVLILCRGGAEEFTPPQQYPVSRYEAGWQKNPFTLKTAPVAMQRESFAKDLVLGSITKIGDSTSVTVINTKTHDRTPLHGTEVDAGGMKVKSVHLEDTRKDTYVEVELGSESAVLRYDESFLKQQGARQAQQQVAGKPGGVFPAVAMNNANAQVPQHGIPGAVNPGIAQAGGINAPAPVPYNAVQPQSVTPASMNGGGPANIPTQARRRLLTAPVAPAQPR